MDFHGRKGQASKFYIMCPEWLSSTPLPSEAFLKSSNGSYFGKKWIPTSDFVTNNRPGWGQNNQFIHPESTSWLLSWKARAHLLQYPSASARVRMERQRVTCHVCSLKGSNLAQAASQEHLLIHVERLQIHETAYSGSHQAPGLQQHCHTCSNN